MPAIISVQDLTKSYGVRNIFENASVTIDSDARLGVIGRNGAGKSTLFRMILGLEEPDSGKIILNSSMTISYLEQNDPWNEGETVDEFLERYTGRPSWECAKTAAGFGLADRLYEPIQSLSGGYRMRVKLTSMLVTEPDFLMLDEPTNFLDLSTQIMLEKFLRSFRGGFMVVSHDREFLKRTCLHTLEVEDGDILLFPGPLEDYFEYKEEELAQKERERRNIETKRKALQNFVDRFRAKASKAAQAQSKMKQIEKLGSIEIKRSLKRVHIPVPSVSVSKGPIIQIKELNCGYGDSVVLKNLDFKLPSGENFAVVGDNGQGKTTLLKTLMGELKPLGGSYRWTPEKEIGYYAQHVADSLVESDTVETTLRKAGGPSLSRQGLLAMAGGFLFRDTDLEKKIKVLSGGEKARLILAGLLLSQKDVLLLDEPTNHLDFETVEALADALQRYEGTVFFVSHDRTFNKIVSSSVLEVANGTVLHYPGNYSDYVYSLQIRYEDAEKSEKKQQKTEGSTQPGSRSEKNSDSVNAKAVDKQSVRKLRSELREAEKKVKSLEEKIKNLTEKLDSDYSEEDAALLKKTEEELKPAEEHWMNLAARIESAGESV